MSDNTAAGGPAGTAHRSSTLDLQRSLAILDGLGPKIRLRDREWQCPSTLPAYLALQLLSREDGSELQWEDYHRYMQALLGAEQAEELLLTGVGFPELDAFIGSAIRWYLGEDVAADLDRIASVIESGGEQPAGDASGEAGQPRAE